MAEKHPCDDSAVGDIYLSILSCVLLAVQANSRCLECRGQSECNLPSSGWVGQCLLLFGR